MRIDEIIAWLGEKPGDTQVKNLEIHDPKAEGGELLEGLWQCRDLI
jgi:hypothetical protein